MAAATALMNENMRRKYEEEWKNKFKRWYNEQYQVGKSKGGGGSAMNASRNKAKAEVRASEGFSQLSKAEQDELIYRAGTGLKKGIVGNYGYKPTEFELEMAMKAVTDGKGNPYSMANFKAPGGQEAALAASNGQNAATNMIHQNKREMRQNRQQNQMFAQNPYNEAIDDFFKRRIDTDTKWNNKRQSIQDRLAGKEPAPAPVNPRQMVPYTTGGTAQYYEGPQYGGRPGQPGTPGYPGQPGQPKKETGYPGNVTKGEWDQMSPQQKLQLEAMDRQMAANEANDQRYYDMLDNMVLSRESALGGIDEQYKGTYADANEADRLSQSNMMGDFGSRGLLFNSRRGSDPTHADRDHTRSLAQIDSAKEALRSKTEQETMAAITGIMERRDDTYDPNEVLALLKAYGEGGDGQGFMGGPNGQGGNGPLPGQLPHGQPGQAPPIKNPLQAGSSGGAGLYSKQYMDGLMGFRGTGNVPIAEAGTPTMQGGGYGAAGAFAGINTGGIYGGGGMWSNMNAMRQRQNKTIADNDLKPGDKKEDAVPSMTREQYNEYLLSQNTRHGRRANRKPSANAWM